MPVLTPLAGSPFGAPMASAPASGIAYAVRADDDLLYVPSAAGLRAWRVEGPRAVTEIAGSPFALTPPSGTLSAPLFLGSRTARTIYMAGTGSGYVVGAALDDAGAPSALPGSPWNFAPDVTNISCMTTARGPTTTILRLIASDAGNRRIAVFDLPAGAAKPVAVPGSPFQLTDTPSDLASGIVVLQPPSR
jgi:hypothetical protein